MIVPTNTTTQSPARPSATRRSNVPSVESARGEAAYTLGVHAYLWGFPLVEYGRATPETLRIGGIALNSFRKFTNLKTAKDRFVVTPNNVTIDAYGAWDVSEEPVVAFVPKLTDDRWYIVQFGDHFDEIFHNVGGTKGPEPGVYVITGPDFEGPIPGEMVQLRARTKMGVAAVRIFVNGEADLARAVEAKRGFRLMPLSALLRHGLAYQPPPSAALDPAPQEAPEDLRFFEALGYWMHRWLPASADASDALVAAFHQIGLSAGHGFDWRSLDAEVARGLARAVKAGGEIVDAAWRSTGETTSGWRYTLAGGRAGHDLALRAALAKYEIGAQLSDQVIYPNAAVDDGNRPLDGASTYVLHFEAGQLPPVAVFWNLAMYGPDMLFVENEIGRCSIGSTTQGLQKNADDSLTIFIQRDRPEGDKASNWLPAPEGSFNLTMRCYGPLPSVLDGSYRLPAVKRTRG